MTSNSASTTTSNTNKRTIPPPAVLEALVDLEFESFVPRVQAELARFCEVQVGKRNEYRRKVKEGKKDGGGGGGGGQGDGDEEDEGEGERGELEEGRERKRVRREDGGGGRESGDGHEQLVMGGEMDRRVEDLGLGYEDEDEAQMEEEEEGEDAGEDAGEEEVDNEDDGDGDDGDDEDDDAYPDEGRRLSSVERETHEGRSLREEEDDPDIEGRSADEGESSDVSD